MAEQGGKTLKRGGKNEGGLTFAHNAVLAWEEMDEQGQL